MCVATTWELEVRIRPAIRTKNFELIENHAMTHKKFDSEWLSLHVLSIP